MKLFTDVLAVPQECFIIITYISVNTTGLAQNIGIITKPFINVFLVQRVNFTIIISKNACIIKHVQKDPIILSQFMNAFAVHQANTFPSFCKNV